MRKKLLNTSVILSLILMPLASVGAYQVAKELGAPDIVAQITTNDAKQIQIYKYEDTLNKTTCYATYFSGWTNGNQTGISCVVNK